MKETYLPPKYRGRLAFEDATPLRRSRRRRGFDWILALYAFSIFVLCAAIVFAGVLTWSHYQ